MLARQLPEEIGTYLRGREGQPGSTFTLQEFYRRVSQKERIEPSADVTHVQAVFAVLNSAVIPADFNEVQTILSDDYEELFVAPPVRN